jgi:hypothetical protein
MKKQHSILPCLFLLFLWIAWGCNAQAQVLDAFLSNSMVKVGVNSGSYGGAIFGFLSTLTVPSLPALLGTRGVTRAVVGAASVLELAKSAIVGRVVFSHSWSFPSGDWFDTSAGKPQVQV